jgi:ribonucleotide reductase beta subunit family protein with ferritin-like domain
MPPNAESVVSVCRPSVVPLTGEEAQRLLACLVEDLALTDAQVSRLSESMARIRKDTQDLQASEPLLAPRVNQYNVRPDKEDGLLWELGRDHLTTEWQVHEIDFSEDISTIRRLAQTQPTVCTMIHFVLAFFATSDGIVSENLAENFQTEVTLPAARYFYTIQNKMEMIHNETYNQTLDLYVDDPVQKAELFDGIHRIPSVARKARWALQWTRRETATFAERLVAFAIVEGVLFSASFGFIFYLKHQNYKLPGLFKSNEFIFKDEGLHFRFACTLYTLYVKNKLSRDRVLGILQSAIETEEAFIQDALRSKEVGLDDQKMIQYVRYVGDVTLTCLGYEKHFHVENPFVFMRNGLWDINTNFFERRVASYSATAMKHSATGSQSSR